MKRRAVIGLILFSLLFILGCASTVPLEQPSLPAAEVEEINQTQETIPEEIPNLPSGVSPTEPESPASTLPEPALVEVQKPLTFEQAVWKKRIDAAMAPSDCPPVTKVEYPSSYYQGPLIDSHYHLPSLPDSAPGEEAGEAEDQSSWPECTDTQLDDCERDCGTLNVADEDLSSSQDDCVDECIIGKKCIESDQENEEGDDENENKEPYLGIDITMSQIACTLQHEGTTRNFAFFPFYSEGISSHMLEMVKRTEEQYPDLFTPFTDMPNVPELPGITAANAGELLQKTITVHPSLFQGYGEISLYELYDPRAVNTGSNLPPDLPTFTEIYSTIKKHRMMVYFHPGENQRNSFERVLKQYQDINFIVHGDQIKDDIDYLMDKYPNIYFTINNFYANQDLFFDFQDGTAKTKESLFAALENYEPLIQKDLQTWKRLIEEHPDQVMWGLDRDEEVLWTFDRDVGVKLVDYGRAFIGRLDPAVQEKFAYKNAERLIELSREDE